MKTKNGREIEEKIKELWGGVSQEVYILPSEVRIELENASLSWKHLKALSEFFETENIDETGRYHMAGCETCDYGAIDRITLTVRPD